MYQTKSIVSSAHVWLVWFGLVRECSLLESIGEVVLQKVDGGADGQGSDFRRLQRNYCNTLYCIYVERLKEPPREAAVLAASIDPLLCVEIARGKPGIPAEWTWIDRNMDFFEKGSPVEHKRLSSHRFELKSST